jgi:hypothetical protein
MDIQTFAEKYRLRTRRDECGEIIIPGKLGQIYDCGTGRFGALFMPSGKPRPRLWGSVRRKLMAAGFQLLQNGDAGGSLLFDPSDATQTALAIRAVGARRKRVPSEGQLAVLARTAFRRAGKGGEAVESPR